MLKEITKRKMGKKTWTEKVKRGTDITGGCSRRKDKANGGRYGSNFELCKCS